jgi:hypothetical protein
MVAHPAQTVAALDPGQFRMAVAVQSAAKTRLLKLHPSHRGVGVLNPLSFDLHFAGDSANRVEKPLFCAEFPGALRRDQGQTDGFRSSLFSHE